MNILFHKLRRGRKGQIAGALTVAIIVFVAAAFIAVNTGKSRLQERRLVNGAQAAVLAGGSSASVLLNTMANLNDQMVLSFAGLTLQIQLMLVLCMIEFVHACIDLVRLIIPGGGTGSLLPDHMEGLFWNVLGMALLLMGATKLGNAVYKMITELNDKLPKQSRDTARQYAFSNAGVDEPKIPCSESGCGSKSACDVVCYSKVETKFDEFMRTLPTLNKNDMNYGTSTIWFSWNDRRTVEVKGDRTITNRVEVTLNPVQKLNLRLVKWGEAGGEDVSGAIKSGGILVNILKLSVSISGFVLTLLETCLTLMKVLAYMVDIITIVATVLTAVFCAICAIPIFGSWACSHPWCPYYSRTALPILWRAFPWATAIIIAFEAMIDNYPPRDIPVFAKELGPKEYPITAQIRRTQDPSSVDYGIYRTNWPERNSSAAAVVRGGSIFPPVQYYDTDEM